MENAIWKDKHLRATEVANEFEIERAIRKASSRKELRCPDEDCKGVVRYCHGEIKGAYFAHLANEKCDYADFDKNDTPIFRLLRLKLYKHFLKLGYDVKCEDKIIEHHYSQLTFNLAEGNKIALEFGSTKILADSLDILAEQYGRIGVGVKWLVVSDTNYIGKENNLYYIKRYLLHNSKNKEYIIIRTDGASVSQTRWDDNTYDYNGRYVDVIGFGDMYNENAHFSALSVEDGEVTIKGFNERYLQWLKRKNKSFEEQIKLLKEQERKLSEQTQLTFEEELKNLEATAHISHVLNEQQIIEVTHYSVPCTTYIQEEPSIRAMPKPVLKPKSYEERKAEIMGKIDQQKEQARDSNDIRWIKCELCGKIGEDDEFSCYGGPDHLNLGICCDCIRKTRNRM